MKVTLYGAANTVTGSAYYVQTHDSDVLVDFGIFQGERKLENRNGKLPPLNISRLKAVIITHGHLDHTGRLPLLAKNGYNGPVFATEATIDIIKLILKDAVNIQQNELLRKNRKRTAIGEKPIKPDYTQDDVENIFKLLRPLPYNTYIEIAPSVTARAREAGHLLGSVSLELTVEENSVKKKVIFSGDLGPQNTAILKDPDAFSSADLVFMESTYGEHDHKPIESTLADARDIILRAISLKGRILVPSFAVGRAQQLLYYMARAIHRGNLPGIPVYLDSPNAIEATRIYVKHRELFDEEAESFFITGVIKGDFSGMKIAETVDESRALYDAEGPCMIMAGSGMCHAGRILHHLKMNLQYPETTVMITGYQGQGTLGRRLVDGEKKVKIFGKEIIVNAQIRQLSGLSAHAGQSDLIQWFDTMSASRPKLVLTHGESKARIALAEKIKTIYGISPVLPGYNQTIRL